MSPVAGIGWSDQHTATGAEKRRRRDRGRPTPARDDCIYCMNQRKLYEPLVQMSGRKLLVPVVCKYCEE